MIAAAVLSSPKLTEQEVESIRADGERVGRRAADDRAQPRVDEELQDRARAGQEPEDAGGAQHEPAAAGEPKDCAQIAIDRNVPEPLRIAARKKTLENRT